MHGLVVCCRFEAWKICQNFLFENRFKTPTASSCKGKIMFEPEEQVENIVFQALAHPMRRMILRIIAYRPEGVSYTDLITELGLSTGKLNYHLEQLEGLAGKNEKRC
jgi:hypothetical protein